MTDPRDPEIRPLPRVWVTWVVVASLVGLGVLAAWALVRSGGPSSPTADVDNAIETVAPQPDTQAPRQSRVGVRLQPEWTLEAMVIAGQVIPLDQLEVREALNEWFFEPGAGNDLQRLPAGQVCVSVQLARVIEPPETRNVGWCFSAV